MLLPRFEISKLHDGKIISYFIVFSVKLKVEIPSVSSHCTKVTGEFTIGNEYTVKFTGFEVRPQVLPFYLKQPDICSHSCRWRADLF
jgi:hypothetical protein